MILDQNQPLGERQFSQKKAMIPFIKRLLKYCLVYKKWLWIMIFAILLSSTTEAMLPTLWKLLIDRSVELVSHNGISDKIASVLPTGLLLKFTIIYVIVIFLHILAERILIFYTGRMRHYVIRDMRGQMFSKMQELSYSYYDKTSAGWLIARMTNDSERLSELMSWGFTSFVWANAMILSCLTAMFLCNFRLTLIVVFILPVLLYLSIKMRILVLKHARDARRKNSELTGYFAENLDAMEVVKSYSIEDHRLQGFKTINQGLKSSSFKTSLYSSLYMPTVVIIGSIATGATLFQGGIMTYGLGIISVGTYAAFFVYVRNIFMPIFDISRTYALAQNSLTAGERIFSLIDEPIKIKNSPQAVKNFKIVGEICFSEVFFGYNDQQKVLTNFNLFIQPGQSVALVGPSGEGKTTIVNLLCRFYEPDSGSILIDDIDYKDLNIHQYLSQVGIISQIPHIFSGTIRDNINFSKPGATHEEICNSLSMVGAENLITRLDHLVGTEGDGLSNGEKQMISFARAILKKPRILIMDEATSSIDAITEQKLRNSIKNILKGRTAIVIAHRLSTIRGCDRILFIQNGNISEQGSHDELMALRGSYFKFYKSYSQDLLTFSLS